jgi:hypothetical protein
MWGQAFSLPPAFSRHWSFYIFQARKATGSAGGLAAGVGQALSPANPPAFSRHCSRLWRDAGPKPGGRLKA